MSDNTRFPDLSEHLAQDLKRALDSYQTFEQGAIPTDAKGFTAWHNACKSALMHIALLMKLIGGTPRPTTDEPTIDWIQKARTALTDLKTEENDDDDSFFD